MKYDFLNFLSFNYIEYNEHQYEDIKGILKKELILKYSVDHYFDNAVTAFKSPFYLKIYEDNLYLRVPVIEGELKHYFANYKDYYYLPLEDICILKTIGSGVDSSYRENAKKETCYIKHTGFFIPQIHDNLCFKTDYRDSFCYEIYSPQSFDRLSMNKFAESAIKYINT